MKDLLQKYRNGQLTIDELEQLRVLMSDTSDKDLLAIIENDWNSFDDEGEAASNENVMRMLEDIKGDLFSKSSRRINAHLFIKVLRYAAILLLPVLIFSTTLLYYKNKAVENSIVCISTNEGEKANITLPDGTKVKLNSNSELSYTVSDFEGKTRNVSFSGEAYFDVAKKKGSTFNVNGKDNTVTVFGTKFNLCSYNDEQCVTVSLEEGVVAFQSIINSNSIAMQPGEVAVLDRSTGKITVTSTESINSHIAWKNNEIIIHHASLKEALRMMEKYYGIRFVLSTENNSTETITGVLPANNLAEALDIIETLYHAKSEVHGREVLIK